MTVPESIVAWLKGFQTEQKISRIDIDILRAGSIRYALVKEPIQNVKSYLSGRKEYTNHYTFTACLPSVNSEECNDNTKFGEALEEWVKEKNKKEEYPKIEEAAVTSITITTPFYLGITREQDSVYQMTIAIKYVKEK